MPSYKEILKPDQIHAIQAYVLSCAATAAAANGPSAKPAKAQGRASTSP
jgi:hypothetical protein